LASATSLPVRHPRWVLNYAGQNITAGVTTMATEISYKDKVEHLSDEVEVTLEDRDRRWQGPWFPVRGDLVELFIGYDGEELLDCGDFQVDELELDSHAPQRRLRKSDAAPGRKHSRGAAWDDGGGRAAKY
jgi:uncharacterized protein